MSKVGKSLKNLLSLANEIKAKEEVPDDVEPGELEYMLRDAAERMKALLEAADLLAYALQVFKDTCDCGECAPCLGAQEMEAVLERLK